MKSNRLTAIAPHTFFLMFTIRELDFSNNRLNFPADDKLASPFIYLRNLELLNLRNNSIDQVHRGFSLALNHLKKLDLSHNHIRKVTYQSLLFHGQAIQVNLNHNRITDIDFSSFVTTADLYVPPVHSPVISLEANPLVCDCEIVDFALFVQKKLDIVESDYLRIKAVNVTCDKPERLHGTLLRSVEVMDLICELNSSYFNQSCPAKCSCAWRSYDQAIIVNCSSADLSSVPNLGKFNYNFTILHIDHNRLHVLPQTGENAGYSEMREIHAQGNQITMIRPESIPVQLEYLNLMGNLISTIPDVTLTKINGIRMRLSNNPWNCD